VHARDDSAPREHYPECVTTTTRTSSCSLDAALLADLDDLRADHLERTLHTTARRSGAMVETALGAAIDFSSNDYLGLASDPRLAAAASAAMKEQGMGAAASRLIAGNNPEHEALDRAVAEWFGAERALTFSTGYAANVGTIPALVSFGDVIFSDALNHASVIDGCRLSRARVVVYPHADADALAGLLAAHRPGARRAMIVTDGVFSMDGDVAPLSAMVELAREWNAWTYVDDAHAAGVIGDNGMGTASAAGVHGAIDVTVGTLGKSFGAAGAFVYGSSTLAQYLINRARSFIFSTAMLPAQAAAAREGLRIARAEPGRRDRVLSNARALRSALRAAGLEPLGDDASHIVPVHVGSAERAAQIGAALRERRVLVGAVRPPTVPPGTSRIRIALSAAHTAAHISTLVEALVGEMSHAVAP
jgi:8-amino-7-oxononanoate synthase